MSAHLLTQPQRRCERPAPQSILIVEDDQQLAEALSIALSRQGYRTFSAHRGDEALRLAEQIQPSLILLDLWLPDANGLDVCAQIDESPATSGTPVIILSGMEGPDVVRRSRAAGSRFFVRKPCDPNALLVLIEHEIGFSGRQSW